MFITALSFPAPNKSISVPDHAAANALLATTQSRTTYRDYEQEGIERVRAFYRNNHEHQTLAFVQAKKAKWLQFNQREMTP